MADTDPALGQDNQEGVDRPDWLPENFKTPEDLASSYRESQRKITEEATARRNLEQLVASQQAQIEQIQAAQTQQPEPEPAWDEWYAQDPIATQKALAEQIFNERIGQLQASQQQQTQATQGSQAEITASLAYKALEDQVGQLSEETRQEMAQIIQSRPHLIPQDAYYSPQKLSEAYTDVYKLTSTDKNPPAQNAADLQRAMKLQAQTATGAGGHLSTADEAQQRWQEIQNASTGTLGL